MRIPIHILNGLHITAPDAIRHQDMRLKPVGTNEWEKNFEQYAIGFFNFFRYNPIKCRQSNFVRADEETCAKLTNEFREFDKNRDIECFLAVNTDGQPMIDKTQDGIIIFNLFVEINTSIGVFFIFFALGYEIAENPRIIKCNIKALTRTN